MCVSEIRKIRFFLTHLGEVHKSPHGFVKENILSFELKIKAVFYVWVCHTAVCDEIKMRVEW